MENVVINFTGDTSGLQPVENVLDSIIDKGDEAGQKWKKASEVMTNSSKTTTDATSKLVKSIEQVIVAAKSGDKIVIAGAYKQYLKDLQSQLGLTNKELITYVQNSRKAAQEAIVNATNDDEVKELTTSIELMNDQLKQLGVKEFEVEEKTASLRARLREAKEELIAMADAGKMGTPEFEALKRKAGELDDQMKDLNTTISNVGSDTRHLDGLISLASGVAGGFAVAQGAAALFGNESEDVQKALVKLNAAMAILQGLQQFQNLLQKENAGMLLLSDVRTKALAITNKFLAATTLETAAATAALRTALIASGIGALVVVVGLAVTAMENFGSSMKDAGEDAKTLNQEAEDLYNNLKKIGEVNQSQINRDILITKNKAEIDQLKQKGGHLKEINDLEKKNIELENTNLNVELDGLKAAQEHAADKTQFTKRELEIKTKLYENTQKQILLDLELNKVLSERASKSSVSQIEAEVAARKSAIIQNQVDSIASIQAVTEAEIAAIKARTRAATDARLNPDLTAGERAKIEAEAQLQILELRKKETVEILNIEKDVISKKLELAKEGSEEELKLRIGLINKDREIELAAIQLTADQRQVIEEVAAKKINDAIHQYAIARNIDELDAEISSLNARLDQFGITEKQKLQLTVQRLEAQKNREIEQAIANGKGITEIVAKYDKQIREAKIASIDAVAKHELEVAEAVNHEKRQKAEETKADPDASAKDRIKAVEELKKEKLDDLQILMDANDKKKGIDEDYELNRKKLANEIKDVEQAAEKAITQIQAEEIEKRLNNLRSVIDFLQKGLSKILPEDGFSIALKKLTEFGQDAAAIFLQLGNKINEFNKIIEAGKAEGATDEDKAAAEEASNQKKFLNRQALRGLEVLAIKASQDIIDGIYKDSADRRKQQLEADLAILEEQKAKELDNKNLTEQQKRDIDDKYRRLEAQKKREAWQADKEAKISQAIINGALAVALAFATNPFPFDFIVAGIVAAQTGIAVAKISSQQPPKFKHGVIDLQGPGTSTSDSIPSMLSKGESVMTADETSKHKDALVAIREKKFDSFLIQKFKEFSFPHVPEWVQASTVNNLEIDYSKLAKEVAKEMAGVIPAPTQIHNTIENDGWRSFVKTSTSITEYKNKRYFLP